MISVQIYSGIIFKRYSNNAVVDPANHNELVDSYVLEDSSDIRTDINIPSQSIFENTNFYFETKIIPNTTGTYSFAIDGSSAIEVEIRDDVTFLSTVVASWYGNHAFAGDQSHNGTISLTANNPYTIFVRHCSITGPEGVILYFKEPSGSAWKIFSMDNIKPWANCYYRDDFYEYSDKIMFDSLNITANLSSLIDDCSFTFKSVDGAIPILQIGANISIYDDDYRIFGGAILSSRQTMDSGKILSITVDAVDYTRFIDKKLIVESFENSTVLEILTYLRDKYWPGFSVEGVDCDVLIDSIVFNYVEGSVVLNKLAEITGYEWYINYNKVIYFFVSTGGVPCPFVVDDISGIYSPDSLNITKDNSQVKNVMYVRGGEYLASSYTSEYVADGEQRDFTLPYKFKDISVTVTGQEKSIGIDGVDNEVDVDILFNFQEKIIKFRDINKPSIGSTVRIGGTPLIPLRLKLRNPASIGLMKGMEDGDGIYEALIVDDTITSKETAVMRAVSQLDVYKDTLVEGTFRTTQAGFEIGQRVSIDSEINQIDDTYLINKVNLTMFTKDRFYYTVSVVSTKSYNMIQLFRDFILKNRTVTLNDTENELLDIIESVDETISLGETFTASMNHNSQNETVTMGEVATELGLDYGMTFTLADFSPPTGKKRNGALDVSMYLY
jgi:hypothetical protein